MSQELIAHIFISNVKMTKMMMSFDMADGGMKVFGHFMHTKITLSDDKTIEEIIPKILDFNKTQDESEIVFIGIEGHADKTFVKEGVKLLSTGTQFVFVPEIIKTLGTAV